MSHWSAILDKRTMHSKMARGNLVREPAANLLDGIAKLRNQENRLQMMNNVIDFKLTSNPQIH